MFAIIRAFTEDDGMTADNYYERNMSMKKMMMAMVAGACLAVFGGDEGDDSWTDAQGTTWYFHWTESGDNYTAKITGASPTSIGGVLTIPAQVSVYATDYDVTEIGEDAFDHESGIDRVVFPATLKSIGSAAFEGCGNLKTVLFKGDTPTFSPYFGDVFSGTPLCDASSDRSGNNDKSTPRAISGESGSTVDDNYIANDPGSGDPKPYADLHATKWFEWTAPKTATVWFWTQTGDFDTCLGACTSDGYADIAHNNDFNGKTSQIAFSVTKGVKYLIYVGGYGSRYRGAYTLKWRMGATVTMTFDPNGGNLDGTLEGAGGNTARVPKGTAIGNLPSASLPYYTFQGWFTKKSGGTKVTVKTKLTKNTKVYAHWAKQKFKVMAKAGGAGAKKVTGSGSYAWGTKATISATAKSGYSFWMWTAEDAASEAAFPNYATAYRKSVTAKVKVPKTSGLKYTAYFVKKSSDLVSLGVPSDRMLYAEDGAGTEKSISVISWSYPKVTTSKLPAGVKFSRESGSDDCYKIWIENPDKVPAGKNVVKVTAKNRSGKTKTVSFVVWGKNKRQAVDSNALYVTDGGMSAKAPCMMYVGVKHTLDSLGIAAGFGGWKITKLTGLPSGVTWDAKKQALKGYTTKTGMYSLAFTVAKGATKQSATVTLKVNALPARLVGGAFYGYAAPEEFHGFFNAKSQKVTVSVTKDGKVSAKMGSLSFSGKGLTYDKANNKFAASLKSSYKKNKLNYTRSLGLYFNPTAGCGEDSMDGVYHESYTKKTSHSMTSVLVSQSNIVGRRNVFGYDANNVLKFEGAETAQDTLETAAFHKASVSLSVEGNIVTVTFDSNNNGTAKLVGNIGKEFTESAVFWYEEAGSVRYLRLNSFNLGTTIFYRLEYNGSGGLISIYGPVVPAG